MRYVPTEELDSGYLNVSFARLFHCWLFPGSLFPGSFFQGSFFPGLVVLVL